MKPKNAAVSIMPSMPMLTTPVRSRADAASAPSVIGVAWVIVTARIEIVAAGPNCTPGQHQQDDGDDRPEADLQPGAQRACAADDARDRPRPRRSRLGLAPASAELDVAAPPTSASRGTRRR